MQGKVEKLTIIGKMTMKDTLEQNRNDCSV